MAVRRRTIPFAALGAVVGAALLLTVVAGPSLVSSTSPHIIWLSPRGWVAGQNNAGGQLSLSSPRGDEEHVTTDTPGEGQWVDYPLQLSNQLRIKRVITCYKVDNAASFISTVRLDRSKVPPTATVMYDDGVALTNTAGACHTGVSTDIAVSGEITLTMDLSFSSTGHAIDIGAVGIVTN
jgi:hypothetical protein